MRYVIVKSGEIVLHTPLPYPTCAVFLRSRETLARVWNIYIYYRGGKKLLKGLNTLNRDGEKRERR